MSTDFSQKERVFVAELGPDTGRDLDGWMAEIEASGHNNRNAIIDWLRQQGFTFARASWIERIYHNGGKLIYAAEDGPSADTAKRKTKSTPVPRPAGAAVPQVVKAVRVAEQEIDDLLAGAKAYRPLAQALVRDILAAVPGADVAPLGCLIVFNHARAFAAVLPGPKDIRLMITGAGRPLAPGWQKAKPVAGVENLSDLTHMIVLTDARQLTGDLKDLIAGAARGTTA